VSFSVAPKLGPFAERPPPNMVTTKTIPRFYNLAAESSLYAELNQPAYTIDNSYPSIVSLDDLVIDLPMVEQFIDVKVKKQIKKIFMYGAYSYLSSVRDECLDLCSIENSSKIKKKSERREGLQIYFASTDDSWII